MAELLLINPASPLRKGKSKMARSKSRKHRTAAQRRATAALVAWNKARRGKKGRKRNPVAGRVTAKAARHRAHNPIGNTSHRRRRNPIALGGAARSMLGQFKGALIGGAGSVAVDLAYGQVARFLPAALQRAPGAVGLGDAVKAVFTYALGELLSKPTRGMSRQMAAGALTVQAAGLIRGFVPASMAMGYYSPARVVQGTPRVGPNTAGRNIGAYTGGPTPLLNGVSAYSAGPSPMLSGAGRAQRREAVLY